MIVMPSASGRPEIYYWQGRWNNAGVMTGPNGLDRAVLKHWAHFALDNDAYTAFKTKTDWLEAPWLKMLKAVAKKGYSPRFAVVPDVVTNAPLTFAKWFMYFPIVKDFGFDAAFAAQDGMTVKDIPSCADVVFIGGSSNWKWSVCEEFSKAFPRVHVGRVNTIEKLDYCHSLGIESVDGSGWFRDPSRERVKRLPEWLANHPHEEKRPWPKIIQQTC